MTHKNIVLFTSTFPYGKGEEFLETEIVYLSRAFEKVILYAGSTAGTVRPVPENVFVRSVIFNNKLSVKSIFFNNILVIAKVFFCEIVLSPKRNFFLRHIRSYFNEVLWKLNHSSQLYKEIKSLTGQETLFYTYWFDNWTSYLNLIKLKHDKGLNHISRIHGFDYDPARRQEGFIPFRRFEMQQVNSIYSVSHYGARIIKKEYPFFKNIVVSHLGVNDHGINPNKNNEIFQIGSCSSVIPLKRLHLIIDILHNVTIPVNWTHFGDGIDMPIIRDKIRKLPANVSVQLKGFVRNRDVITFYSENQVDLFINVSEFEGIPVSIMEAMSFGIPSIGCDVGGVPEIVTPQTGFLFQKEFNPKEVSACIESYYHKPEQYKTDFRQGVKKFWSENYNAAKNYPDFIHTISQAR